MLPDGLKKRAEEKAESLGISLGEFLRAAAESYLDKEERRWIDDPLVNGDFLIETPAPAIVSENVDRYLYGKKK
jgi:hypothetical protein